MEVIPDDLVRKCLMRVPYNSHNKMKDVCRRWESMVTERYVDRKIYGIHKFYADRKNFRGDLLRSCSASFSSRELYSFIQEQQQVMKYDGEKNVWGGENNNSDVIY